MANQIELATAMLPMMDEVYYNATLTGGLDGAKELARAGANANEMVIPRISLEGLARYARDLGYVSGDLTLTNQTVVCNFDRGRMFRVDALDNMESAGVAFGRLASEFIRTKVVPELDAFRMAVYASKPGVGLKSAAITTGDAALKALRDGMNAMDAGEVPYENRFLFINNTLLGMIEDLDTTKSKQVLASLQSVVCMPQNRLYTGITQMDGVTAGQTAGGYKKADGAKDIQFMLVHKDAVIQFQKHIAPKVIAPEHNANADAWLFGYRNVGIADVYENKVAGIYVHTAA